MKHAERDTRFDTLKGFLIFLVAAGHILQSMNGHLAPVSRCVYSVIYSFHMPAFAFISGYFSKNTEKNYGQHMPALIRTILLPLILAQLIIWFTTSRSLDTLLCPQYTLWYLLSCFFWRILVVPFSKIRFSVVLAVIITLLAGFTPNCEFLSVSRTVGFFPFFLIGYKTSASMIGRLRKINRAVPALVLLALFTVVAWMRADNLPVNKAFFLKDAYDGATLAGQMRDLLFRLGGIAVGCVSAACLLMLVPEKESFLSVLGRNTMPVYLGHSIFTVGLYILKLFPGLCSHSWFLILSSFAAAAAVCLVFGNKWTGTLYNRIIHKIADVVLIRERNGE